MTQPATELTLRDGHKLISRHTNGFIVSKRKWMYQQYNIQQLSYIQSLHGDLFDDKTKTLTISDILKLKRIIKSFNLSFSDSSRRAYKNILGNDYSDLHGIVMDYFAIGDLDNAYEALNLFDITSVAEKTPTSFKPVPLGTPRTEQELNKADRSHLYTCATYERLDDFDERYARNLIKVIAKMFD